MASGIAASTYQAVIVGTGSHSSSYIYVKKRRESKTRKFKCLCFSCQIRLKMLEFSLHGFIHLIRSYFCCTV